MDYTSCNKSIMDFSTGSNYLSEMEHKADFSAQIPRQSGNSIYAFQARCRDLTVGMSGGHETRESTENEMLTNPSSSYTPETVQGHSYMRAMSSSYINSGVESYTFPHTAMPHYLTDKFSSYYYPSNTPVSGDMTSCNGVYGNQISLGARYRVHTGGSEFDPDPQASFSFHTNPPPPRMFPSMNINVSMKMNLGLHAPRPYECYYESGPAQYSQTHMPTLTPSNPGPLSPRGCSLVDHASLEPYYPAHYPTSSDLEGMMSRRGDGCNGGGSSSEISQLLRHPAQEAPNLCRICGKVYARPSTLKTHMRTHSGERPYKCSQCNKTFSQAANLTAHMRTHSGDKPFRCQVCDRRFSQSSSVTTHMRTHSGERPYRCRMCRKAFSDSSTLTKHLRVHSGEKPYQCKRCLIRFSQSGNLNRHMRIHASNPGHGIE